MFRFSIREMMLVTLVVAIVISWFVDHQWAWGKVEEARSNADFWETKYSEDEAQLRKQLAGYGLEWSYNVPGGIIVNKIAPP